MLIDALAAALVLDHGRFDVIVASNLFGDILSDLAAEETLANDGPRTPDLGGTATTAEVTAAFVAAL